MKTHTIKTPTAELLIVELPECASTLPCEIINGNTYISYSPAPFAPPTNLELLANGNWKSLGKPDEIREEDAEPLVEYLGITYDYLGMPSHTWKHYGQDYDATHTAKESLLSLIETEIYWSNPIEEPSYGSCDCPDCEEYFREKQKEFEEAEQKTFDRNRTLIFVKN